MWFTRFDIPITEPSAVSWCRSLSGRKWAAKRLGRFFWTRRVSTQDCKTQRSYSSEGADSAWCWWDLEEPKLMTRRKAMVRKPRTLSGSAPSNVVPGFSWHRWSLLLIVFAWLLGPTAAVVRGQSYLQSTGVPAFTTKLPVEN